MKNKNKKNILYFIFIIKTKTIKLIKRLKNNNNIQIKKIWFFINFLKYL